MYLRAIPRALVTALALFNLAIPAIAQSNEARPRVVTQTVDLNETTEELVSTPAPAPTAIDS